MAAIDLNSLVPDLVDLAFDLSGQITATVTYTHRTGGSYNPSTGTHTPTLQTASASAILANYKQREIDGDRIKVGDRKAILKMSQLTSFTSKGPGDTLTISGVVWQIVTMTIDPTNYVMTAQIRKVS